MSMSAAPITEITQQRESIKKLSKDLRDAAKTLSRGEARFLVDYYYISQDNRKRAAAQVKSLVENSEPHATLGWLFDQSDVMEKEIKKALGVYATANEVGAWSMGIVGIGPVISAGLLAHIDIEKAPTPGHIWRFAGLDPTSQWNKGEKRPFNAALKVLCWHIGQSFIKQHNHKNDVYGKLLMERRDKEIARNEAGELADQAAAKLEKFKIGKATEAFGHYSSGRLPPAHILARSQRWATKLFLSHWWEKAYTVRYGSVPPDPYPIAILGHAHKIEMP